MDFDDGAQLDTSSVQDRRGGGGGGIPGGGLAIGGGGLGLLVTLLLAVLGVNGGLPIPAGDSSGDSTSLAEQCSVDNARRFEQADCRNVAVFNDLQQYWSGEGAPALGVQYADPDLVLFDRAVNTACGSATSAVGPFYCPGDNGIYIDLSFYDELASRFGAPGQFAQAYVVAHEFGHHMQTLTGQSADVRRAQQEDPDRANELSIRLELQADCYAGVWAANAGEGPVGTTDENELAEALDAAAAIGDDRIQQRSGSEVSPDTWTHGSSEQRRGAFFAGYESGDPTTC